MIIKDIAYERRRTRDLLLEYNVDIMPPHPRAAGLSMVYPWENIELSNLIIQLYSFATHSGYEGTIEEFKTVFGSYLQGKQTIFDTFDNFPEVGDVNKLYFDTEEKILYYWENEYKPINTLLIEGTILNAGSSTVSID